MEFYNNSIFWIETDKIKPNPFQPRREFDEEKLKDLAGSIRQYGVLQPLVVTRIEKEKPEGGITTEYELISGERRLRASKLAGISQVPVLIKAGDQSDKIKLELAIIENLQREDLNPIERAKAFKKLADEFNFTHSEIGERVGKSRVYVTNTLRLLLMPEELQNAVYEGKIAEGHTRPLLMLNDRPEEQTVLFKEIILKRLTVREAELIARRVAYDKARKKERMVNPQIIEIEGKLTEVLGTRVLIEQKENGGKITIDYFNESDLQSLLDRLKNNNDVLENKPLIDTQNITPNNLSNNISSENNSSDISNNISEDNKDVDLLDDRTEEEKKKEEEEVFDINNFSI